MKIKFEKFNGTFVFGVSLSIYKNKNNKKKVSLIFDLGKFALAFIFGKENKMEIAIIAPLIILLAFLVFINR